MTRIPDAIDKLIEIWAAVDADIIDGWVVSGAEPRRRIYVGYDGDPDDPGTGASGDQSWAGTVGTQRRNESFTIPCVAVVHQGGSTVKAARDAAFAVFNSASDILRANVDLGMPPPTTAQLTDPALAYVPTDTVGLEVHVRFNVNVTTRI